MRKILISALSASIFMLVACSKKEEAKPTTSAKPVLSTQLRIAETDDDEESPVTVSTPTSSGGSVFLTLGFKTFDYKPVIAYSGPTLIPVVAFPAYSAAFANAGVSEGCYNEFMQLYSKALAVQSNPTSLTNACEFISELEDVAEGCSQIPAASKAGITQMKAIYTALGVCN